MLPFNLPYLIMKSFTSTLYAKAGITHLAGAQHFNRHLNVKYHL